jgi:hypothetical protein
MLGRVPDRKALAAIPTLLASSASTYAANRTHGLRTFDGALIRQLCRSVS